MDNTDSQMLLKNVSDAIGKRLVAVVDSADFSRMLLVFDDGSKCQLSIVRGYESGDEMLVSDREFDSEYYNKDLLLKAGVVDANWIAEHERKRQEVRRRMQEQQEAQEAAEYERLKRKFEPVKIREVPVEFLPPWTGDKNEC